MILDRLKKPVLQNPYAQFDENKLKLKPTDNNKEALNFVFGKDNKTPSDRVKETNLYRNYQFFFGKVNQENWQTVYTGLSCLILVYMKIQKGDNAQRIFESLNATGVDLSKGDLIRNYVLTGLERQEQEAVFQNYWIHIEKNTVDEGERKQSRKKKTNTWNKISMFFLRFLQYKNQTKDVKEDEVFEKFNAYLDSKNLTDVLKELKLYSEGFYLFLNPQKVTSPDMRQHLIYLKQLKSSVIHPFLLPVYADLRNEVIDEKMFVAILELLQSYHWRRMIANGEVGIFTSNYLLSVTPMLYDTAKPADNPVKYVEAIEKVLLRRKFPDDKQIMEALHTKSVYALDNSWQRYLFERLGRYIDDEGNVDYSSVTTDHVFPKNPETNWNDGSHILSEKELQKMADLHHRLGNLTPLIHRKKTADWAINHFWKNVTIRNTDIKTVPICKHGN
ncbi:hypothetical protein FACS1894189_5560 [Planctomycetales bacterium]|nr:hypothetical protein FACS1894189_5560 [Planctomycetales bacterium]